MGKNKGIKGQKIRKRQKCVKKIKEKAKNGPKNEICEFLPHST